MYPTQSQPLISAAWECLSSSSTTKKLTELLKALAAAADMGIKFWTTPDSYGPFNNESLLGRWFKEIRRGNEILSTKFGVKVSMPTRTTKADATQH
jgi:aryl-alcohol dehydrogenase-like predicted oxidoreductase